MNDIFIRIISEGVVPLLITGLGIFGGQVLFRLKSRLKNDNIRMALDQIERITKGVVLSLNQTVVANIKSKSEDGKLTAEDIRDVKEKAVLLIKAQIQDEFLELLAKNTVDVNALIETSIESAVFESKR